VYHRWYTNHILTNSDQDYGHQIYQEENKFKRNWVKEQLQKSTAI